MNIQEYISSGILEAYALGELSDPERVEVEANLARYPALREELARAEEAQEALLMSMSVQPREAVKTNLFEKIDARAAGARTVPISRDGGNSFWKFAAAASVTVALVASFLAYNYWNKWKSSEADLNDLIAQNQRVARDYDRVNQRLDKIEKDFGIITDPAFKRVVLKGTANAPEALANIYWNQATREVYLDIQNMKQLAQANQYQLWAIIDGKPVDAGVFDGVQGGNLLKMKDIGSGAAVFAVTIEPRGGKQTPSLETMQVAGNVEKS